MPWALLMKLGRDEAERLGAQIGRSGNERWMARFLTMGSLRSRAQEEEVPGWVWLKRL